MFLCLLHQRADFFFLFFYLFYRLLKGPNIYLTCGIFVAMRLLSDLQSIFLRWFNKHFQYLVIPFFIFKHWLTVMNFESWLYKLPSFFVWNFVTDSTLPNFIFPNVVALYEVTFSEMRCEFLVGLAYWFQPLNLIFKI